MNKKTYIPKTEERSKVTWTHIDANGQVLGKLATKISKLLLGKDKETYTPGVFANNKIVVTNAAKVAVTGKKQDKKFYYKHSDFPGAIKKKTLKQVMEKDPREIVKLAVKGMLPRNKLTKKYLANLYIYPTDEHPHKAHVKESEK